jgi:hypothetical protein
MSRRDELDQELVRWMGAEAAAPPPPNRLDAALDSAVVGRPLPRWRARFGADWLGGNPSFTAIGAKPSRPVVGRPILVIVLALLVVAALAVGLVAVGGVPKPLLEAPPTPALVVIASPGPAATRQPSAAPTAEPSSAAPASTAAGPYLTYVMSSKTSFFQLDTWIARADGSEARLLSQGLTDVAWSSDGSRLLVVRFLGTTGQHERLYLASAADGFRSLDDLGFDSGGAHACPLPHRANDVCQDDWFAMSPDGRHAAFERSCTDALPGCYSIATIDLGTGRVTVLQTTRTTGQRPIEDVDWSPDASRILFTRSTDEAVMSTGGIPRWDIFIVDADGQHLGRLDLGDLSAKEPRWSPDGSTIAFASDAWPGSGHVTDVYTVHPDGTGLVRLTMDGFSSQPEWTSDGRIRIWDGDEFRVIGADGTSIGQAFRLGIPAISPPGTPSTIGRLSTSGWPPSGVAVQPIP